MNTNLLVSIIMAVVASLLVSIFFQRRKKDHAVAPVPRQTEHAPVLAAGTGNETECDLAILDENGFKILESREIQNIPAISYRLEPSGSAISRVRHMAADLFKGAASLQNKTVEVIFKPEIQRGLADGT